MASYILPTCPDWVVDDRFSCVDVVGDGPIPFWWIVQALLKREVSTAIQLVDILETIKVTLGHTYECDYATVKEHLSKRPDFFALHWPQCVELALDMNCLFPSNSIPALTEQAPQLVFSRRQIACLVVHQFLGTLQPPSWFDSDCSPDFHIWYHSYQPHQGAVSAYLDALFTYLSRLEEICSYDAKLWSVTYTLHEVKTLPLIGKQAFCTLSIRILPEASTSPDLLGLTDDALPAAGVISANRLVGFGKTGTQEEVNVGCSPEACPCNLLCPPLKDNQALIVRGAEAMLSIKGYGRLARRDSSDNSFIRANTDAHVKRWSRRSCLFMDALELDQFDGTGTVPDLLPGHLERELQKAFAAFASEEYGRIYTGRWGCRSFCGNEEIKTIVQWMAASLAGTRELVMVVTEADHAFADRLAGFVDDIKTKALSLDFVWSVLSTTAADSQEARHMFAAVTKEI